MDKKNLLQYCEQHHLDVPIYRVQDTGTVLLQLWLAHVLIGEHEFAGTIAFSSEKAMNSASMIALLELPTLPQKKVVTVLQQKLIQHCKTYRLADPIYRIQETGMDKLWQASVLIGESEFFGISTIYEDMASENAAMNALSSLTAWKKPVASTAIRTPCSQNKALTPRNTLSPIPKKVAVAKKTVLLVDLENMPKFISQLPMFDENMTVYAFVSERNIRMTKKLRSDVKVITAKTCKRDGADICMQMHLGTYLNANQFEIYLLASNDHFAGAAKDIMSSDEMAWTKQQAIVVKKVADVIAAIAAQ